MVVCWYWIDNSVVSQKVRDAVEKNLRESVRAVIDLPPADLAADAPKNERKNLYNLVGESGGYYRVVNMEDYWVQDQIRSTALMLYEQDPTTPVCKITSITLDYAPSFDNAGAFAEVQYVDPIGVVRSMNVNVIEPLRHLPVKQ